MSRYILYIFVGVILCVYAQESFSYSNKALCYDLYWRVEDSKISPKNTLWITIENDDFIPVQDGVILDTYLLGSREWYISYTITGIDGDPSVLKDGNPNTSLELNPKVHKEVLINFTKEIQSSTLKFIFSDSSSFYDKEFFYSNDDKNYTSFDIFDINTYHFTSIKIVYKEKEGKKVTDNEIISISEIMFHDMKNFFIIQPQNSSPIEILSWNICNNKEVFPINSNIEFYSDSLIVDINLIKKEDFESMYQKTHIIKKAGPPLYIKSSDITTNDSEYTLKWTSPGAITSTIQWEVPLTTVTPKNKIFELKVPLSLDSKNIFTISSYDKYGNSESKNITIQHISLPNNSINSEISISKEIPDTTPTFIPTWTQALHIDVALPSDTPPGGNNMMEDFTKKYIQELLSLKAINTDIDTFMPQKDITRAEFLKILFNVFKIDYSEEGENISMFTDLEKNDWKTKVASAAIRTWISNGYPDNTFRPDNPISRIEAIKFIVKLIWMEVYENNSSFIDVPEKWMTKYLSIAKNKGIINGEKSELWTLFKPLHNITRGESAKIIINGKKINIE